MSTMGLILPQVGFANSSTINCSTDKTPFNIVYIKEPNHMIDVAILPQLSNNEVDTVVKDHTKGY